MVTWAKGKRRLYLTANRFRQRERDAVRDFIRRVRERSTREQERSPYGEMFSDGKAFNEIIAELKLDEEVTFD